MFINQKQKEKKVRIYSNRFNIPEQRPRMRKPTKQPGISFWICWLYCNTGDTASNFRFVSYIHSAPGCKEVGQCSRWTSNQHSIKVHVHFFHYQLPNRKKYIFNQCLPWDFLLWFLGSRSQLKMLFISCEIPRKIKKKTKRKILNELCNSNINTNIRIYINLLFTYLF